MCGMLNFIFGMLIGALVGIGSLCFLISGGRADREMEADLQNSNQD